MSIANITPGNNTRTDLLLNDVSGNILNFDRLNVNTLVSNTLALNQVGSFNVPLPSQVGFNKFNGDGNLYIDQGATSTAGFIFRNNNGGTILLSILNTGVLFPTVGGTPTAFNYYEQTTFSTTFTGGTFTSGSIIIGFIRAGSVVTMTINGFNGAATASITNNTAIPARFRPASNLGFTVQGLDATVQGPILLSLSTVGFITLSRSNGTAFSLGNSGITTTSITYPII
jgi:hypothetical protein